MRIRGAVDLVTRQTASGWIHSDSYPTTLDVQATLDNQVIGEAVASILRTDLAEAGVGDGKCGFLIEFYREIDPAYIPFVLVKIAGGDAELPRYSSSGYDSFFNALFARHPSAGRSRSVLGGLWTDRTDAKSILKGKIAVGQILSADSGPLERVISDGYTTVYSIKNADSSDLLQCAADVLSDTTMITLLRRIFDDQPVALSVKIQEGSTASFVQPSALTITPSPAECVSVVVPLGKEGISIDVVRKSHEFPEFSASGESRWTAGAVVAGVELALTRQGLIDRDVIKMGEAALIGPGLLHRVQADTETRWLHIICAPARHTPLQSHVSSENKSFVHGSGVRVFA